ncbi:BCCT family transporter [Microbulbifer flavimaris]|uniref:BCCT family transporter n=1 Tax=Microbulbifer flavimaris TaxID=1781068 RepID=A0ABX4HWX3_9GAMM|nr:choline transporter [Microbulbifer sp. ZGT114]PCO04614.1 BCCT family transporter [Microbulbifer flavimaris]
MPRPRLDLPVFLPAFGIAVLVASILVLMPQQAEIWASDMMSFVTGQFGWLFVIFGFGTFVFALWLAFGRFGQVKLSRTDEPPEYSELSWAAMMFSAGIGIGLVSWSFVEPIYYLSTPPLNIEPNSASAAEWGHMYSLFHWSFVPWALYAVPSVAVAYMLYVSRRSFLRVSEVCRPLIGRHADGWAGKVIDTLIILGLIGGAGTSLGLGVPLVSALTTSLLGIEESLLTQLGVIGLWTLIFGISAYKGLKAGIRILSDINIYLAVLLVLLVLLAGPTVFILSLSASSLGLMLDSFTRISFWLDPIRQGGFPDAWTLFYWAWWIAYAPLMGLFFGRISRGRTIRQMVLGIMLWGSLGCIAFLSICGAYALELELSGKLAVTELLNSHGIPATVVAIVQTLPFSQLVMAAFTLLSFVFLATTLDSSAYVLASISTRNLSGEQEPAKANRLAWAFALAMIAIGLLFANGLDTVKSLTIILALPLTLILFLIFRSLLRALDNDFGRRVRKTALVVETTNEELQQNG